VLASPFRIIAHRGASAYAPENTLPAFRLAEELGAIEVELDVGLSADDVLILFHDSELDAKTSLHGPVRAHPASTLTRTDIGSWFDRTHPEVETRYAGTPLATLDEVLTSFGPRFHYHVEIKGPEPSLPQRLLELVTAHGLRGQVTITSFSKPQLERVRALDPAIRVGWLLDRESTPSTAPEQPDRSSFELRRAQLDEARDAGFAEVAIRAEELDTDMVDYARELGLEIRAWGVKSDADMEHAIATGANGMTTNWPDRLLERVERAGR